MSKFMKVRRVALPLAAILVVSFFTALPGPASSTAASGCPAGYLPKGADSGHMSSFDVSALDSTGSLCLNVKHPESYAEQRALAAQRYSMQAAPSGIVPAGAFGRAYKQRQSMLKSKRKALYTQNWDPIGEGPLQAGDDGYGISTAGLVELAGRITDFFYIPATDKYYPDTLIASMSYGGVWMADGSANYWTSIGDALPTQVTGSVAYSPANGGTFIALSGDGSFGADSREGAGVFYSTNGGRSWNKGVGVPDDSFGFKLAVDNASPTVIYAATGSGLYRSTNAAKSWTNVNLPTGDGAAVNCTGKSNRVAGCLFANIVSDVAVIEPGGTTLEPGHKVLATVGWRGGSRRNPDGTYQSQNNGIYTSDTGAPGTFTKSSAIGFAPQSRIGRIQIGAAIGPAQNHNVIYAMVQDAVLLRHGVPYIDAPTGESPTDPVSQAIADSNTDQLLQVDSLNHGVTKQCKAVNDAANTGAAVTDPVTGAVDSANGQAGDPAGLGMLGAQRVPYECAGGIGAPTVFNGIYVSPDWGKTWTLMEDATGLQNPASGSTLAGAYQAQGYAPGVQSWYNEWIHPDPTLSKGGIPTRVLFGLEEVWENDVISAPQVGPSSFHVIGRYFSGDGCQGLTVGIPIVGGTPPCPTQVRGSSATAHETTTHPDQHAGIFVPTSDGNLRVVVGNDGGAYSQRVDGGNDFSNANWGVGNQRGFNTLLPYDAVRAADGTVWMGLQDNGTAKIFNVVKNGKVVQRERTTEVIGGDGFFVGVAPQNGNVAYEEYVGGAMSATTDGGRSWSAMAPPITNAQFSNPFVVDPKDGAGNHVMTAGRQVVETMNGPGTTADDWHTVFNLGTAHHPANPNANDPFVDLGDPVNQMTAIDLSGDAAYVGFCGTCDILNNINPFQRGLATNVGGSKAPKRGTSNGWHMAKAKGLPNRYITGIAIDPKSPKTVYVSLGGYLRLWTPVPGNATGPGHLYVSTDAGEHFRNITGNLPDTPVNWVIVRGTQQIVATDIGVYISNPDCTGARPSCQRFQVLGNNLPMAPVFTVRLSNGDPNMLIAALYGRGVYSYRLGPAPKQAKKVAIADPAFLSKAVHDAFSFDNPADDEGWSVSSADVMAWSHAAPGASSAGSMAAVPYTDNQSSTLTSPQMALPSRSTVKVSWWERRDSEPCCDYMTMQWSSDGKNWRTAYAAAGQNPTYPDFSPASATFVAPKGKLFIRFGFSSDALVSSPPYTGVAVDSVVVQR